MKKELRDEWIAALRSGKYKQTQANLCNIHGYCCLGVLASVAGKTDEEMQGLGSLANLEFDHGLGEYQDKSSLQYTLADLNDDKKLEFTGIANFIEQNVPVTP